MSITLLKQNAEILLEVAGNYDIILEKGKGARKEDLEQYEVYAKNFRNQFLYLLAAINKLVEQEKNAR